MEGALLKVKFWILDKNKPRLKRKTSAPFRLQKLKTLFQFNLPVLRWPRHLPPPRPSFTGVGTFFKAALLGKSDKGRQSVTVELKSLAKQDLHYSYMMAECFTMINEQTQNHIREEKEEERDHPLNKVAYNGTSGTIGVYIKTPPVPCAGNLVKAEYRLHRAFRGFCNVI